MRRVDFDPEAGLVRPSPTAITPVERVGTAALHYWTRIGVQPAAVFVLLSLVFGAATAFVVPPLRGPDEIAHFLRIYSYTRGELLPAAEGDGRKGMFVTRDLYD